MCRSICEGRSWPRLRGAENKGPPKISSRLGAAEDGGRERALKAGALEMLSLPAPLNLLSRQPLTYDHG